MILGWIFPSFQVRLSSICCFAQINKLVILIDMVLLTADAFSRLDVLIKNVVMTKELTDSARHLLFRLCNRMSTTILSDYLNELPKRVLRVYMLHLWFNSVVVVVLRITPSIP